METKNLARTIRPGRNQKSIDATVRILSAIHARNQDGEQQLGEAHFRENLTRQLKVPPYEKLCRQFFEFQRMLSRQKLAMERLLGRVVPVDAIDEKGATTFQQTIHMQCPKPGRSSARFRCVNRTGSDSLIEFGKPSIHGDKSGRLDAARISMSPASGPLQADDAVTMEIELDLTECGGIPDSRIDASVEVITNTETALKLWIVADLYEPD